MRHMPTCLYPPSWDTLCRWVLQSQVGPRKRFPSGATQRILSHKGFPSECSIEWRDMCKHIEEGLEV